MMTLPERLSRAVPHCHALAPVVREGDEQIDKLKNKQKSVKVQSKVNEGGRERRRESKRELKGKKPPSFIETNPPSLNS